MRSPQPVTLICIGPAPNIAAALKREPRIAQHARFVGMDGSVRGLWKDLGAFDDFLVERLTRWR